LPVELDRLDRIKKSSLDIAVRGGGLGSTISNPNLDGRLKFMFSFAGIHNYIISTQKIPLEFIKF